MDLTQDDLRELKDLIESKIVELREGSKASSLVKQRERYSNRSLSYLDIKQQHQEKIEHYELLKVKVNMMLD